MGRYLATGVMTSFAIKKKKSWFNNPNFNLNTEVKNVLKDIRGIIDSSIYELVKEEENYYEFALKPEVFDKNIHELIREISPLTCPNVNYFDYFEDKVKEKSIDLHSKEFIKNYPFKAARDKDGNYIIKANKKEIIKEDYPFYPFEWMLNDYNLFKNVEIRVGIILLWMDFNKYIGEDETKMLKIINTMKAKYYSSPLSKALIYYVTG